MSRFNQSKSGAPASQRQLRVGEEIRHALSSIFMRGETNDPGIDDNSITVSEVRISPDLKNATAFVMPLGGGTPEKRAAVMEALVRSRGIIRTLVSSKMLLRHAPRIHFKLDESYDQAHHIETLLNSPKVAQDLKKSRPEE